MSHVCCCSSTAVLTQRSEFAGLYDLLKAQPFDREFFEVVLMSETSLVNRLTKVWFCYCTMGVQLV